MSEYPTSFMMKLLMLCVPVPSRVLRRQPLDVSHPLPNMIACRVCYEDDNICEIDEYQRAICSNCIVKMSRIDTCLRCDKTICSEHPLILDSQQIDQKLNRLAYQVYESNFKEKELLIF